MKEQEFQEIEYTFPYHYVSQYSGRFSQTFHDPWGIHYVSTIEYLLGRLGGLRWESAIDVGCGDGRLAREISMKFPRCQVEGVDVSERAIALAKAMNLGREGLEFAVRDITAGVPEKRHDVAILMEVLEHIPVDEAVAFLRGVAQQIVHGGFLLLTVPHENKPVEYKHFRHFSVSALMAALNADFDVLEVVPFERRCLSMRLLGFMLGNRYFLLNHRGLLKAAYSYYKRHLFPCADEGECQRLFVVARVR